MNIPIMLIRDPETGRYNAVPALQGAPGISIDSVDIDENNHLIVTLTDGTTKDAGELPSGGGGGGAVLSVNDKTGEVELTAEDVGADPAGTAARLVGALNIPAKTSDLQNDSKFITLDDVPAAPVSSVNSKTGAVNLTYADVGADQVGAAGTAVAEHNVDEAAHNDIRLFIEGVNNRLNTFMNSEDIDLDQAAEFVAYMKANRSLIESITTSKVSVSDIIDNLITNVSNKPLSAAQGVALKALIDGIKIPANVSEFANDAGYLKKTELPDIPDALSDLTQDSNHRVVTDAEKAAWNGNKVTADSVKTALGYTPANVIDVFESTAQPTFTNVFDAVEIEYGKLLNGNGEVETTATPLAITGFIPVEAGQTIRMQNFALYTGSNTPNVSLYDGSKVFKNQIKANAMESATYYFSNLVKDADGNVLEFTVNAPGSLAYIRICTHTSVIGGEPVLTVDEEIQYEMGYGTKMNPAVRVDYGQITNAPQKNGWNILPYEHLNICYSGINRKPINTVEHFTDAAENFGYNALKCDVRPTSDGELVCCHDAGFTFDGNGYITTYSASNSVAIHDVTAETVLGYSFSTGEHPCLVGDYLDVCREYGKVAFITIRNEYMDVVIPKLLEELRIHNMTYSAIINCMTYESLVQWRQQDQTVMINYTLNFGVAIDRNQIDRAVSLRYCSLCGFSLSSSSTDPSAACDFEYARANGIRLLEAIAYKEGSPEACYAMGYDGCQIGIPWNPKPSVGITESEVDNKISAAIGDAIGGSY